MCTPLGHLCNLSSSTFIRLWLFILHSFRFRHDLQHKWHSSSVCEGKSVKKKKKKEWKQKLVTTVTQRLGNLPASYLLRHFFFLSLSFHWKLFALARWNWRAVSIPRSRDISMKQAFSLFHHHHHHRARIFTLTGWESNVLCVKKRTSLSLSLCSSVTASYNCDSHESLSRR